MKTKAKKFVGIASLLLAVVFLLVACNRSAPVTGGTAQGEDFFKELRVGYGAAVTTYNPFMEPYESTSWIHGSMVAMMVSQTDPTVLEWVPHHAAQLPYSEDGGKTWIIKFRQGMTWSDGEPLNAYDYYYSMKMILDPVLANRTAVRMFEICFFKNALEYYSGQIKDFEEVGIKLIDNYTLEITLENAVAPMDFWGTVNRIWPAQPKMYEACMNADRTSNTYGTTLATTPSSSCFTLTEWVLDSHDYFLVNPNDPLVQMGYIKLDAVSQRYVVSSATRSNLFFSGETDWHSLTGSEYNIYRNDPRALPVYASSCWGNFVNSGSTNKVMSYQDLRRALFFGNPREQIAREAFVTFPPVNWMIATSVYVGSPITGTVRYRDTPEAKKIAEEFASNTALAREYFDKAYTAIRNDLGLDKIVVNYIYFDSSENYKAWAEITKESYETLFGRDRFELNLRVMVGAAGNDAYRRGEYDMGNGVRTVNIMSPWAGMRYWSQTYSDPYPNGFYDPRFEYLLEETTRGSMAADEAAKLEALYEMERIIMNYVTFIPIFQNDNLRLYSERILLPTSTYFPVIDYSIRQADILYPEKRPN